jgi:flagellar protein FliS
MYASPFSTRTATAASLGGLYRKVGVESAVPGATPHQLIAMLFDGLLEAIAQARGAMQARQVEAKAQALSRAVRIVEEGLRAGLDLKSGGSLARDLHELYGYLAMRLTLANLRNDDAALQECTRLVQPLREAWLAIGDAPSSPRG